MPFEARVLQALPLQHEIIAFPGDHLDPRAGPVAEHEQIGTEGIHPYLVHEDRAQTVDGLARVD